MAKLSHFPQEAPQIIIRRNAHRSLSGERDMTAMRDTSWIKRSYPDLAYAPLSSAQVLDLYLPNDTPDPYPCLVGHPVIHRGHRVASTHRLHRCVEATRWPR